MTKKIGYLGPPGTFSEMAARLYLSSVDKGELIPFPSLTDIFMAVEKGGLTEGILPLENSTEGSVNQTLDLLAHRFGQAKIKNEIILSVNHHLLARTGIPFHKVVRVVSHPQALAQCRSFLENSLPGVEVQEAASTAEAAALVATTPAPWAAIGTAQVAQSCGLVILAEKINDSSANATRFVVVAREDAPQGPGCKTSIIFSVEDRPGALCDVLLEFAERKINLTRIESRPTKNRLGEYLFFVDFQGHRLDQVVQQALLAVSRRVVSLRVLGSYPAVSGEEPKAG